jgi:hypothetical protein
MWEALVQPVLPVPHDHWSNLRTHQFNFEWGVAEALKLKSRKQREKCIDCQLFIFIRNVM